VPPVLAFKKTSKVAIITKLQPTHPISGKKNCDTNLNFEGKKLIKSNCQ
jgi:hypothetical protein